MTQPCLPFGQTIAERFEQFHRDNPQVYAVLVRLAREWIEKTGRHKIGIGALTERARWDLAIETKSPDFRINNNFRSFYARMIQAENPDLTDVFELRASEADSWAAEHYRVAS